MKAEVLKWVLTGVCAVAATQAFAQDDDQIEEVVVTGSQIRGASISEALPVSVINTEDIEALGVDSGDELLEFIAEQGQNFFSESENISGGVNSARGDIGAYNLRNLGTGNTLVLLNGRRLVNAASYQTEEVGGSFVPVNTVNSQSLAVAGLSRAEVLRDGASAIYGADAVAGVVNYVMRTDFEGFRVRARVAEFDHLPRGDQTYTLEWGRDFNGGRTNVSAFLNHYRRDRVNSQDDPRWANSDFRSRLPAGSPWADVLNFRNNSVNALLGQFDILSSASGAGLNGPITDSAGEFEIFEAGDPRCAWDLGFGVCGAPDGQGFDRYNLNENRDLYSKLDRTNLFAFLSHTFDNGMEAFTEFSAYLSNTNTIRHPSARLSAVRKFTVAADSFYNPFGPCGSTHRLPDSTIGTEVPCEGLSFELDNYRFEQVPRIVDNDGQTWRILQGLRGNWGAWDWEGAVTWSKAEKEDITRNRVSNTLLQEALNDTTPAAFNPFSRLNSNIERALVDVRRDNETELTMIDFKVSRNDVFSLPAGDVGILAGIEYREESFIDDRDPRLDGTINFVDRSDNTYPFISDIANSSPTPDSFGEREVTSLFTEIQLPIFSNFDAQLALRFEDFSDVGSTTVGKFAVGYRPVEPLLLRASVSEAFRAPNLVTINEAGVARSNTIDDQACFLVDPNEDVLDCRYGVQRTAQGSRDLRPEESTNTSIGFAYEPLEGLTLTLDFWSIEKEDTIGLFGEENHIILDLLERLNAGTGNCAAFTGNPAVIRDDDIPNDVAQLYLDAGICPAGEVIRIDDEYANLNTRTVRGHDIGIYYNVDTAIGNFDLRLVAAFLDTYDQDAGGDSARILNAQNDGTLPGNVIIEGFGSLVRQNGNPESKQTMRLGWSRGDWRASLTGVRIDDFVQTSLTLSDGTQYVIPSMTTFNGAVTYYARFNESSARIRFGVNNLFDERAPLADDSFGYFADQHRDLGRFYNLDVRFDFGG
ncbi:MAG: TonB-dependent receptor [Gammaproteobacteria bacterium]